MSTRPSALASPLVAVVLLPLLLAGCDLFYSRDSFNTDFRVAYCDYIQTCDPAPAWDAEACQQNLAGDGMAWGYQEGCSYDAFKAQDCVRALEEGDCPELVTDTAEAHQTIPEICSGVCWN